MSSQANGTQTLDFNADTNSSISQNPVPQEETLQKQGLAVDFTQTERGYIDVSHAVGRPEVGDGASQNIFSRTGENVRGLGESRVSVYLPLFAFFFCLCFAMTLLLWRRKRLTSVANQRWEERLADDLDDGVYRPSTYNLEQRRMREPRLEFSPTSSPSKA